MTIRGGHIAYTGLFGIDFEANDDTEAHSIRGIVDGVDIRHHGDLPSGYVHLRGRGRRPLHRHKPSMLVQNLTGDRLNMTISNTTSVTVRNNVSDTAVTADLPGCGSVTFTGNVPDHQGVARSPPAALPMAEPRDTLSVAALHSGAPAD